MQTGLAQKINTPIQRSDLCTLTFYRLGLQTWPCLHGNAELKQSSDRLKPPNWNKTIVLLINNRLYCENKYFCNKKQQMKHNTLKNGPKK